jgi:hypothetical protein
MRLSLSGICPRTQSGALASNNATCANPGRSNRIVFVHPNDVNKRRKIAVVIRFLMNIVNPDRIGCEVV